MAKFSWLESGALHDLIRLRKKGLSLKKCIPIIAEKYGKSYTVARLSQVLKSVRDYEAVPMEPTQPQETPFVQN